MGAVTYPDANVIEFINNSMIPIRLLSDTQPYAKDFNIKWTPSIITLDESGKEHHRVVGFLPPEEFIPAMMLGIAKVSFDLDRFDKALVELEKIIAEHPKSKATPEAIYLRGVSGYKSTKDPKPLKEAYEKLHAEYPESEWAARALPYRLIS
jgi:tetratricopeptide (TPR) repeat protein